ncbi:GTP cyclohydrolase I [Candidatus Woesearchaeota archaeon]|nr:GTP cyclohydrolase I [Candidatus Woesearchaeota archaeon]MCF7901033.1 GTP cyclohydrolase I [Candidatus Woesearchaeota archaeon]MCF8013386.1 GTP cyclohydrolase I [Candidatus Woesearchaeota archaeon]
MNLSQWIKEKVSKNKNAIKIIESSEDRISKAYKEMLRGYEQKLEEILSSVTKVKEHNGLVAVKRIKYVSICGHHFLPFYGEIDIIYEPNKLIIGIGKLPRLAQMFAKRFQYQEFITRDIAKSLKKIINAKGVFVRVTGTHMCMCARGPNDKNAETITTYAVGSLTKYKRKQEILNLLN